jgi:hypothetical protein
MEGVRLCGSSNLVQLSPDRLKNDQDFEMMGAFLKEDMDYRVPNFEVGYVMRNTPVPVGFWRGVNHSQNGFFSRELCRRDGPCPWRGSVPVPPQAAFRKSTLTRRCRRGGEA